MANGTNKNTNTRNEIICFRRVAISLKIVWLNGWAFTDVVRTKRMMKRCIKLITQKRTQNRKGVSRHRKYNLFKAPMPQRQGNYYGFVKTRVIP